jgi:flavodoxin
MMKALIIYYSRTGTTKKVAEQLAQELKAELEEIIDLKNRKGPIGYVGAGKDAMQKNNTPIGPATKDPSKYDLIIIGSPIWSWTLTPAVRSYVTKNKPLLKGKRFAFFTTMGGSGDQNLFTALEELLEAKPLATLTLFTKEVTKGEHNIKVKNFARKLKK